MLSFRKTEPQATTTSLSDMQERVLEAARTIEAFTANMEYGTRGKTSLSAAASLLRQYVAETL